MDRLKELAGPIVSHCAHVQYAHTCTYMYDMTCTFCSGRQKSILCMVFHRTLLCIMERHRNSLNTGNGVTCCVKHCMLFRLIMPPSLFSITSYPGNAVATEVGRLSQGSITSPL